MSDLLVIGITGPSRSGKTTVAWRLFELFTRRGYYPCSVRPGDRLKEMAHRMFDCAVPPCFFEGEAKDRPQARLCGVVPRELYGAVSERVVKPLLGADFFGRTAGAYARRFLSGAKDAPRVAIAEVAFVEEMRGFLAELGVPRGHLIRLHRDGTTYAGDSRTDLGARLTELPEWDAHVVDNTGPDPSATAQRIFDVVTKR